MSKVTVTMCDVKGCRSESIETIKTVVVSESVGDENDMELVTYSDVDMCSSHRFRYVNSVIDMEIKDGIKKS